MKQLSARLSLLLMLRAVSADDLSLFLSLCLIFSLFLMRSFFIFLHFRSGCQGVKACKRVTSLVSGCDLVKEASMLGDMKR